MLESGVLPAGRYLSVTLDLPVSGGGQSRALLQRNRLFLTETGVVPTILTFCARPDWEQSRQKLVASGLLPPEIPTLNIYEHYRRKDWTEPAGPVRGPMDLSGLSAHREDLPDGSPWRVVHHDPNREIYDYLRADGSPFLRIPGFDFTKPRARPSRVQQLARDGTVIGEFRGVGQWFRRWILECTGGERSFLFIDSRLAAQQIVPMRARNVNVIFLLHNIHTAPPRLWSSPIKRQYVGPLSRIADLNALVTLTDRQHEDISMRYGATSNLFTVPHPAEPVAPPDDQVRDPHLVAVVARLEGQKRLHEAIRAFASVRKRVPEARMVIYGEGSKADALAEEVSSLDLQDEVTFKGYDPFAREALWKASAFLVTSSFEGWNLALQESMSRGCPVVSYDVKYGPREQITDGVDGFLVPDLDRESMTERVVQLLTCPELVDKLGSAAMEKTRESRSRFLRNWQLVLESVVEGKPYRTSLDSVDLHVNALSIHPARTRHGSRRFLRRVPPSPDSARAADR